MTTSRIASFIGVLVALCASPSLFADCTTPQTFAVTSNADDGSPGTLRFFVDSPSVQDCDTIEIPAMTIVQSNTNPNPIEINKNLTIRGAGIGQTIIDANFLATGFPGLVVDAATVGAAVTLQGVTVRNGGVGVVVAGQGSLEAIDVEVVGNAAQGILVVGAGSSLILDGSTVSDNGDVAPIGGGIGFSSPFTTGVISDSIITRNKNNDTSPTGGGGITMLTGDLQIYNSTITENDAGGNGGGILNVAGVLNIVNTEISDNISRGGNNQGGGGIATVFETNIDNCLIANNVTLNNTSGGGIGAIGDVNVFDSIIEGNRAEGNGGGITTVAGLNVFNSTIRDNIANFDEAGPTPNFGGGIFMILSATIVDSVISGNVVEQGVGGAISDGVGGIGGLLTINNTLIDGNTAINGDAGAIFADILPVVIRNTTISNNRAQDQSQVNGGSDALGGAIFSNVQVGGLDIANSTIFGNSSDGDGGAIANDGLVNLSNVTIAGNTADANEGGLSGGDGGGIFNISGAFVLNNSIIAGNIDASVASESPDCVNVSGAGLLNVLANNFIGDLSDCDVTGNEARILTGDALLDTAGLADNDGKGAGDSDNRVIIKTVALQAGSPAIDAGTDGSCPPTDQRGVERPQGEHCDLGAFEGAASVGTTGGDTTGGDTTGGDTGGDSGGGCSLVR